MQLASESISCLITALHSAVQLTLEVLNLCSQLRNGFLVVGNLLLLHLDLLAKGKHLVFEVCNRVVSFAHLLFKLGDLRQEFLFTAFAGSAHVLLFIFDLAEEFSDPGLQFTADRFSFVVLICGELSKFLLVLVSKSCYPLLKICLHLRFLAGVRLLHRRYCLNVLLL